MHRGIAWVLLACACLFPFAAMAREEIPGPVAKMLDIARAEYEGLQGEPLPRSNKYTIWYYNDQRRVDWCVAFAAWCAERGGLSMVEAADVTAGLPAEGPFFPKEAKVVLQCQAFEQAERLGDIPRPGYAVVYGEIEGTPYARLALVETVRQLDDGSYEMTTLEGNVSDTIQRYCYRYHPTPKRQHHNLSVVPEDERVVEDARYELPLAGGCVTGFGQTYLSDETTDPETTGGT